MTSFDMKLSFSLVSINSVHKLVHLLHRSTASYQLRLRSSHVKQQNNFTPQSQCAAMNSTEKFYSFQLIKIEQVAVHGRPFWKKMVVW